jgi:hypothetical protein
MTDPTSPAARHKPENLLANLACNLVAPTAIMSFASGPKALGPAAGLATALVFPIGYGIYDFTRRRRVNFISLIGFASVLVTGGFGLLKLDAFWFAVKDGALPLIIGVAVLASLRSREPLIHEILYNPQIVEVDRIAVRLAERGTEPEFDRLIRSSSYLIALAMFVSGGLNYLFARLIIHSPAGTETFNQELAKMHWVSLAGISLPVVGMMMFALWRLLRGLERLTGLEMDDLLAGTKKAPKSDTPGPAPSA